MITKKELLDYAKIKGFSLGNAEKDYLIDMALSSISRHTKNELVFKGGTCLYKFHNLNRFSEDIDFSVRSKIDVDNLLMKIIADFEKHGIYATIHEKKEPHNSVLITLRIKGPLFLGNPMTYANLGIDINLKSEVVLEPEFLSYNSIYPDIASISAFCMNGEEIFAEKIRAIMSRERARDLFDLNFLLEKNIRASLDIVSKKLDYYNEKFDLNKFTLRIQSLEKVWKKELMGFTSFVPDFNIVSKNVIEKIGKMLKK